MPKRFLTLVLIVTLLSACTPASETPIPTGTPPAAASATRTSPPPTETATLAPPPATATPTRRPTITPLTIPPTPTPTSTPQPTSTPPFVYGLQPTLTPAAPALCPQISTTEPIPAPPSLPATLEDTLAYLNTYGPAPLRDSTTSQLTILSEQDLTQDGVPEILAKSSDGMASPLVILGCREGAYQVLFDQPTMDGWLRTYQIIELLDANRNGLPEILFRTGTMSQGGHFYDVYEWDGSQFRSLLEGELWAEAFGQAYFEDRDGDYLKELVNITGLPSPGTEVGRSGLPWRSDTEIYRWDGTHYRLERSDPEPPTYRFQALQDADYYASLGEYEHAQALYQAVIFDPLLGDWSLAQGDYLRAVLNSQRWGGPMPTATPAPDPNEYGHLAAYARFRLMLLHLLRGMDVSAQTVYDGLQEAFPEGTPGSTFAEMAAEFWSAYQAEQGMGAVCQAAVSYASFHPEGLVYLGDWYHGFDSVSYKPAMVCPFK